VARNTKADSAGASPFCACFSKARGKWSTIPGFPWRRSMLEISWIEAISQRMISGCWMLSSMRTLRQFAKLPAGRLHYTELRTRETLLLSKKHWGI
jgi:hypothetical protein